MIRMNPLRRMAATAAIIGVTGFGAVALATPALADQPAWARAGQAVDPAMVVTVPAPDGMTVGSIMSSLRNTGALPIQSPLPAGPVTFVISKKKDTQSMTLPASVAQLAQTVLANAYAGQGYQVTFTQQGVLVIGLKLCDLSQPMDSPRNAGCVVITPNTDRF